MERGRRLRVLWFSTTPSRGGAALGRPVAGGGWIRALEERVRSEVDLTVAFYDEQVTGPFEHDGTTFRPMLRPGRRRVDRAVGRLTQPLESAQDIARLAAVVNEVGPDLVHVHGTEGPFGLVQRYTDRPVLISLQAVMSVSALKYFSGVDRRAAARFAPPADRLLRNTYADRYRRFAKQAAREREILRDARHVAGRTTWDRRAVSLLAPAATYHHVDEILRAPFYGRTWRRASGDTLRLFTTTGPNLYKGFETLVSCAALLEEAGVGYSWSVAGLGSDDAVVRVVLGALGRRMPAGVRLLGTLGEDDLADRMLEHDLYVGVSHTENSPNSLCEAQLLGLPCVATYAGGTGSLMTDEQDGVLVQDGDPYAMAGAILELARDPVRAADLGAAARARARARHDPVSVTAAVLDVYRRLADGR